MLGSLILFYKFEVKFTIPFFSKRVRFFNAAKSFKWNTFEGEFAMPSSSVWFILFVTPKAKMVRLSFSFNFSAGTIGSIPRLDLPSVITKISFLTFFRAPAFTLNTSCACTNSSAFPVDVFPLVYLIKVKIKFESIEKKRVLFSVHSLLQIHYLFHFMI